MEKRSSLDSVFPRFVKLHFAILIPAWQYFHSSITLTFPGYHSNSPLFRESILNGAPEVKEAAAHALGEAIQLTTDTSLQPSVIHITGPLIRILGDRFAPSVKAAVLQTLAILLAKVGLMLKQFLPQLQTTFLKALNDSNRLVRLKAAMALSHMMQIHNRPDPLFQELHQSVKTAEEPAVR